MICVKRYIMMIVFFNINFYLFFIIFSTCSLLKMFHIYFYIMYQIVFLKTKTFKLSCDERRKIILAMYLIKSDLHSFIYLKINNLQLLKFECIAVNRKKNIFPCETFRQFKLKFK